MFKSSRRVTVLAGFALCTLLLAGSTAWLAPAAHGQNPQDVRRVPASPKVIAAKPSLDGPVLAGLKHKVLAGADVQLALVVDRIGTSGQDGIATNVEPAREWKADIRFVGLQSGAIITYSAVTDRPVSTMVWKEKDGDLEISASFDRSPTYSLKISNGGTTVLTQSAIPRGAPAVSVLFNDDNAPRPRGGVKGLPGVLAGDPLPGLDISVEQNPGGNIIVIASNSGECQWEAIWREPMRIDTGDRVVLGDRIVLTAEYASGDAPGPMVFTQMRIQAARLSSFTIRDERVERPVIRKRSRYPSP